MNSKMSREKIKFIVGNGVLRWPGICAPTWTWVFAARKVGDESKETSPLSNLFVYNASFVRQKDSMFNHYF